MDEKLAEWFYQYQWFIAVVLIALFVGFMPTIDRWHLRYRRWVDSKFAEMDRKLEEQRQQLIRKREDSYWQFIDEDTHGLGKEKLTQIWERTHGMKAPTVRRLNTERRTTPLRGASESST